LIFCFVFCFVCFSVADEHSCVYTSDGQLLALIEATQIQILQTKNKQTITTIVTKQQTYKHTKKQDNI
jgi:hypothetical protein